MTLFGTSAAEILRFLAPIPRPIDRPTSTGSRSARYRITGPPTVRSCCRDGRGEPTAERGHWSPLSAFGILTVGGLHDVGGGLGRLRRLRRNLGTPLHNSAFVLVRALSLVASDDVGAYTSFWSARIRHLTDPLSGAFVQSGFQNEADGPGDRAALPKGAITCCKEQAGPDLSGRNQSLEEPRSSSTREWEIARFRAISQSFVEAVGSAKHMRRAPTAFGGRCAGWQVPSRDCDLHIPGQKFP
jgi:hypothetical protein